MSASLKYLKFPALILALVWVVGCVQVKPVPGYARAGDYIVLGLGGVQRNAGGVTSLRPDDLTISITDANSTTYDLEARHIFKSFPDYGAWVNTSSIDGSYTNLELAGLVPFDGGWFAVVPLTEAGTPDQPLPLAEGAASVSISSPKLSNTADNAEGDLTDIPLEILAGVSPYDFDYLRQFTVYEEFAKSFVIAPSDLTGIDTVGGAYLVVEYTDDSFFRADTEPMAVPINHDPFIQLSYNHVSNGDGTGKIYITLLNPYGFTTQANATPSSSLLTNLPIKFLYFTVGFDPATAVAKASFSIDTANSYYIGLDGSPLAGVAPVLTHFEDL